MQTGMRKGSDSFPEPPFGKEKGDGSLSLFKPHKAEQRLTELLPLCLNIKCLVKNAW